MSVTTEHMESRIQAAHAGAFFFRKEATPWINVALGAVALSLYLVFAATTELPWPVLIGPFVLLGISRLMGLRSLWQGSPAASKRHGKPSLGLLDRALRDAGEQCGREQTSAPSLEPKTQAGEPQVIIDRLKTRLGSSEKSDADSLYIIGRQYMRLGQYAEAREWLRRTVRKSKKPSVPLETIEGHISTCNLELLAEGDDCFASGDLHGARERYARLSLGLGHDETRHFAIFLRSACVYCELKDYADARQSVLQALKADEAASDGLVLLELLNKVSGLEDSPGRAERAQRTMSDRVADIMDGLRGQRMGVVASAGQ